MRLDLIKDLSAEDTAELERLWKESELLREIIKKALEKKLIEVISSEDAVNLYQSQNWNLTVADSRGFRRGLKYAIDFLNQRVSAE